MTPAKFNCFKRQEKPSRKSARSTKSFFFKWLLLQLTLTLPLHHSALGTWRCNRFLRVVIAIDRAKGQCGPFCMSALSFSFNVAATYRGRSSCPPRLRSCLSCAWLGLLYLYLYISWKSSFHCIHDAPHNGSTEKRKELLCRGCRSKVNSSTQWLTVAGCQVFFLNSSSVTSSCSESTVSPLSPLPIFFIFMFFDSVFSINPLSFLPTLPSLLFVPHLVSFFFLWLLSSFCNQVQAFMHLFFCLLLSPRSTELSWPLPPSPVQRGPLPGRWQPTTSIPVWAAAIVISTPLKLKLQALASTKNPTGAFNQCHFLPREYEASSVLRSHSILQILLSSVLSSLSLISTPNQHSRRRFLSEAAGAPVSLSRGPWRLHNRGASHNLLCS